MPPFSRRLLTSAIHTLGALAPDPNSLRAFLSSHDAACPRCGYNLRGVRASHCPECGSAIDLAALQEHEQFRLWRESRLPNDRITTIGLIGAVMGMAWPIGIAAVLIRGWTEIGIVGFFGRILLILAAAGHIALAVIFLRWTLTVSTLPRSKRVALASAAWMLGPCVVLLVALIAAVRLLITGGQS